MMQIINFVVLFLALFCWEVFYFRIAREFGILDIPNERSAHKQITIRGIGIIFLVAALSFFVLNDFQYIYFFVGLFLIGVVSFIDDLRSISNLYRIIAHFVSVLLLLYQVLNVGFLGILTILFLIISVGIINAFNFMDGVNGITGAYGLVCLGTLLFYNVELQEFVAADLILYIILSLIVFLFFNFRKRAIGFGGDVGSVSLAFIILFILFLLIHKTGNWKYIFFLALYGLDTIYTIVYRIKIGQNIFEAHKLHFFQILVHQYRWAHLKVALLFAVLQLMLNIWVLKFDLNQWSFYIPFALCFIVMHRFRKRQGLSIL